MLFFTLLLTAMLAGDVLAWLIGDRALRRTRRPRRWRIGWGVFFGLLGLGIGLLLAARILHLKVMVMPEIAVMALYIWHFILLPVTLAVFVPWETIHEARRRLRKSPPDAPAIPFDRSRRDFLTRVAVVTPPVALIALTGQAAMTEDDLILTRRTLAVRNLPPQLEGLTIAHVSDPHLGMFITDRKVQKIINLTNELDADLVLQTGDLINSSLDDLVDGIALVRQFRSRYGVYCCQGNHDVIASREKFESETVRAGINMMLDENRVINVRGQRMRLIAPRWTGYDDKLVAWSVNRLVPAPIDDLFTILTVHHPHGFDAAAALNIPLTLSGHTHGGQIALTRNIGVGPLIYRYWSGEYHKANSACYVSNGIGNWFPLRINVPCEVVHLTLTRAR